MEECLAFQVAVRASLLARVLVSALAVDDDVSELARQSLGAEPEEQPSLATHHSPLH